MKESQPSRSNQFDPILPCSSVENSEEEDEFTMADAYPFAKKQQRLRGVDPDLELPSYVRSTVRRNARNAQAPARTTRLALPRQASFEPHVGNPKKGANEAFARDRRSHNSSSEDLFDFNDVDWMKRRSFSIPETDAINGSGSIDFSTTGLGDETKSVGNPWDEESAFGDESTFIQSYVALDEFSVVPSSIPRPAHALSTMISSRDLNTFPNEHLEALSPTLLKLASPKSAQTSPMTKGCSLPKTNDKLELLSSPETSKSSRRSGASMKKKVICLSSKDFAALGFGNESTGSIKLVVKERKTYQRSELPLEEDIDSTITTQPTTSSQDEASSDTRRPARPSTSRRSSLGATIEREKQASTMQRRRMSNNSDRRECSTRTRTMRRGSLDMDTCRQQEAWSPQSHKEGDTAGRRRSISPRRTLDGSTRRGRTATVGRDNDSNHRSTSRVRNVAHDVRQSGSKCRSRSPSRRIVPSSRDRTHSHYAQAVARPGHLTRTVSSRIRDIGITPEQLLLLQKCGLTISDSP